MIVRSVIGFGAPNKATARQILEAVKIHYAEKAKSLYEEPRFKEDVGIGRGWLAPQRVYRSIHAGATALTVASGKPTAHTVLNGEIASTIARKYRIPLQTLFELNPGRDLDHLQIGDVLRVRGGTAPLTVVVKESRKGPSGEEKIVTYENGIEVRAE